MATKEVDLGPVRGDINDSVATFTQASTRANINSGETGKTIFGKIKKWFADMGSSAFCAVVNNATTTAANTVLDGRMGKTLGDRIDELNRNMQSTNTQLIPKTIFTGSRDINDKNIWNDTLSFADFSTVRFTFSFQNQVGIFDVRPMHDDNLVHAVSYGFNSNDDVARLLFGRIKFSGRYITKAEFKLSYGLAKPEAITSGIYVVNIVGFNY